MASAQRQALWNLSFIPANVWIVRQQVAQNETVHVIIGEFRVNTRHDEKPTRWGSFVLGLKEPLPNRWKVAAIVIGGALGTSLAVNWLSSS